MGVYKACARNDSYSLAQLIQLGVTQEAVREVDNNGWVRRHGRVIKLGRVRGHRRVINHGGVRRETQEARGRQEGPVPSPGVCSLNWSLLDHGGVLEHGRVTTLVSVTSPGVC